MGIDPGEGTTSIGIFFENAPRTRERQDPEMETCWDWVANVTLRNWGKQSTFEQCTVIRHLIDRYHPVFVATDATGWGHDFMGPLRSDPRLAGILGTEILDYGYRSQIVTDLRVNRQKARMAETDEEEERLLGKREAVKEQVGIFSMFEVQRLMILKRLWLPSQRQAPEIHDELSQIVGQMTASGNTTTMKFYPEHPHYVSGCQMFAAGLHDYFTRVERKAQEAAYQVGNWRSAVRLPVGQGDPFGW